MKLTKYAHACLLVETEDDVTIFDPGVVSYAVQLATQLKPQVIVPIHDWMWNDTWKKDMYDRLEMYFKNIGITFLKMTDGTPVEIQ